MTANKLSKLFRKIWFLFAVFLLPSTLCLLFYYFFIRQPLIIEAKASLYKTLPYYGPKIVSDKGDTIYSAVKDIDLINLEGNIFSTTSLKSKVLIVNFFTLQNIGNSNKMAASLFRAQKKLGYLKKFAMLSVNLTPEKDSLKNLVETSNKVHALPNTWVYYTGKQTDLEHWARVSFGIRKGEIDSLTYTNLYLIDLNRNIRGVYDGTKTTEVNRMIDEVKVLNQLYRIK